MLQICATVPEWLFNIFKVLNHPAIIVPLATSSTNESFDWNEHDVFPNFHLIFYVFELHFIGRPLATVVDSPEENLTT